MAAASSSLKVGGGEYEIFRLDALQATHDVERLPFTLRILLENALRTGTEADVEAVAGWVATDEPSRELSFTPARVLHQDFTGVPAVVDLVAMRDAMRDLGGDPVRIDPELPSNLVIDHSVQVDAFASRGAMARNTELEFERNRERYAFLRFGQQAFDGLTVVPPATGIVHQVNLEFLARVVQTRNGQAFPDTLLGTDSHTTMVNGLGVLGWGVGGIEAEAAMLGEAVSMLVPQVVGFRLTGRLPDGSTATDLVLTVTQILRELGVVGKFVEYFGAGLAGLPVADRATLGNMSPEYGATCGFFPVDEETLAYLRLTGRDEEHVTLVEAYCKENLLWHDPADGEPTYTQVVELDLATVEPSLAGPRRPQDRVPLRDAKESFLAALPTFGVDYGTRRTRPPRRASPPPTRSLPARPATRKSQATATVSVPGRRRAVAGGLVRAGRRAFPPRPRRRRHRRHHELHEHLEPAGDGRRGPAREEGRRARPRPPPVGEVEPRAGLEGRHAVPRRGRPHDVSRGARLPHGRVRLHDLHRELGAAAGRDLARDLRRRPRRGRGAVGEPELRGAHPPGGQGELPRARRRSSSRTRSPAAWTSTSSTSRSAAGRTARTCISRTSGPAQRRCRR